MNITEFIFRHSHAWSERVAIIQDGKSITYGALRHTVETVGARLVLAGVTPGDCVAVGVRNPFGFLAVLLALARMGATATPLRLEASDETKEALLGRLGVTRIVVDQNQPWRSTALAPGAHIEAARLFVEKSAGEQLPAPVVAYDVNEHAWLIALSSGTTGLFKGIPHTHERTMTNVALGHITEASRHIPMRLFMHSDISISVALNNFLRTMLGGGTAILVTSWLPGYFFERVVLDKPTRVLTTTALAGRLVEAAAERYPDSLARCASLQSIVVSGSIVSPALREAIRSRICPHLDINYGAAEAGALATANEFTLARHKDSAGRLHPWVRAEAVDDDHNPLPTGQTGLLRFSSPTLASRYLGDEVATAKAFRDGWFYPGDRGAVDEAGFLFLAGRADDRLNLGGRKIDPLAIEMVLESYPDVLESAVVGVSAGEIGRLVLVAVVVTRGELDAPALTRLCEEKLGASLVPAVFIRAPSLPRNASGKVMRDRVVQGVKLNPGQGTPE